MNEYSQLRDILDQAVGEPPCPVTAEAVRRRARRHRTTHVLAATAAVTAVACVAAAAAFAASASSGSPVPAAGSRGGVGRGVPAYYIQQSSSPRTYDEVRSTVTGALTDTIRCPGRGDVPGFGDLAAGGSRTFFVACGRPRGLFDMRIYRFRISSAGHATGLVLLASGPYTGLAAADGGSLLAAVTNPSPPSPLGPTGIALLSARTGRELGFIRNNLGSGRYRAEISAVSLSSNGRELAFYAACARWIVIRGCPAPAERILGLPAGGPEPPTASSRVLPDSAWLSRGNPDVLGDQLSPDGSALSIAYINWNVHHDVYLIVGRYSVRAGRLIRYLYRHNAGHGIRLEFTSFDPSGQYPILGAGGGINAWIDHGRWIPLRPAAGASMYEAW
jgi:hypothetical protein